MTIHRLVARLLIIAAVVVTPLVLHPFPVAAADGLRIEVDTVYEVAPDEGVVHVESGIEVTNTSPDKNTATKIIQYYYNEITVPIPVDAVEVTAKSGSKDLNVDIRSEEGGDFKSATISLPRRLLYQRTQHIDLTFDIKGAAPRSPVTDVRVNPAYVWFYAWSFGDPGRSTVSISVPNGFEVSIEGNSMSSTRGEGGTTLYQSHDISDPQDWFAVVSGFNDSALTSSTVTFGDGTAELRHWPGDEEWRTLVATTLAESMGALREAAGIPWPLADELVIRETVEPNTYGYGGWFLLDANEIEVGEEIERHLILHEVSHAWFNDELFEERWIAEGLAEEISAMVLRDVYQAQAFPSVVRDRSDGAVRLNAWTDPTFTEESDSREEFGYNASWWVVHDLAEQVGPGGLARVTAAAHGDQIAYLGAGEPETVAAEDDWRRFLDLLEERAGAAEATSVFRDLVVLTGELSELEERSLARSAYRDLEAVAEGWQMPISVRMPMSDWDFELAHERIGLAEAALVEWRRIEAMGAERSLTIPATAQPVFEGSREHFEEVFVLTSTMEATMEMLDTAETTIARERDLYTKVGLANLRPELRLEAAREAFEADDPELASRHAGLAVGMLTYAAELGRERVIRARVAWIGVGVATLLLVLLLTVRWVRWRRAKRRPSDLATSADPADMAATAVPFEGSG